MMRSIMLLALALPIAAAAAVPAKESIKGRYYCYGDVAGVWQQEQGYTGKIQIAWRGELGKATFAGGAALFSPTTDLKSYLAVDYEIPFDDAGKPTARPAARSVSLSTGRFAGTPPGTAEQLTLRIAAGDYLSPFIAVSRTSMNLAAPDQTIGLPGSTNPFDFELPQPAFDELVYKLETQAARAILLYRDGREIARIPMPDRDLQPERQAAGQWFAVAMPLIVKRQCPG